MKAKWKQKWVAALRSGNFKQGQYVLRNTNNKCCCMGVLADIGGAKWVNENYVGRYGCNFSGFGATLNPPALEKFGLSGVNQDYLTAMNDSGKTFKQIATWIEKNL